MSSGAAVTAAPLQIVSDNLRGFFVTDHQAQRHCSGPDPKQIEAMHVPVWISEKCVLPHFSDP